MRSLLSFLFKKNKPVTVEFYHAPPILTDEFKAAMTHTFWCADKNLLSTNVYYYWKDKYQPIEESEY